MLKHQKWQHWCKVQGLHNAASTTSHSSDAKLFFENKQANMKNKPKMGNLTEKQAQHAFVGIFKKT